MDLPSSRELELETLLRQRDTQIAELSDEVTRLRQYLLTQPSHSTTDPITLPPTLVSILLPHLNTTPGAGATPGSSTVTAALTQRARLLQEENDELYSLLKHGETGKLKEEVRGLRRVVDKLEGALRESHQVISSLSTELDKSYDSFMATARQNNSVKAYSQSPRNSYHPGLQTPTPAGNGTVPSKLPPTGPRAHKKPRLSEPQASPPPRQNSALPSHVSLPNVSRGHSSSSRTRGHSPQSVSDGRAKSNHLKMEVDEDTRKRPRSPGPIERDRDTRGERGRDRERERERERERVSGRERDRDRDRDNRGGNGNGSSNGNSGRSSRRNGNHSGGGAPFRGGSGGGAGRRADRGVVQGSSQGNSHETSVDRTLAERMGL